MMQSNLFNEQIVKTKEIDRDILTSVLINELKDITEYQLVNMLYSKFEAIIDFFDLCNGGKSGEKISMLFNPHRYSTKAKDRPSIIDGFSSESFLSGLARATIFKHGKVKELLYQVFQLGINSYQYICEFPPFVARDYYIKLNAKKILDPCAGWGGRMIGAASIGAYYHGFEPSTKTYSGLLELGKFLKQFNTGFDFKIENLPFEDGILTETYDVALTSPPYYDTEIYSDEETNSCNRYKTFDEWKRLFYIPMIEKTMSVTNKFILNVGTRRYDLVTPIYNLYPNTREINSPLSGKGGLGKKNSGKESFYLIERN